jgi:predicted  nucleic acid-binding Zn-ribbon protein
MSVEFSNAYQEILLENLMSVIKQNFIFQTQIKLTENLSKEKSDLEKSFFELNEKYNSVKGEVDQLNNYKQKAEQNSSAHEEKSRIQSALNETMRKNSALQKELEDKTSVLQKELTDKNEKIKSLELYVKTLESHVASSKLKKINSSKTVELPIEEDGSSF